MFRRSFLLLLRHCTFTPLYVTSHGRYLISTSCTAGRMSNCWKCSHISFNISYGKYQTSDLRVNISLNAAGEEEGGLLHCLCRPVPRISAPLPPGQQPAISEAFSIRTTLQSMLFSLFHIVVRIVNSLKLLLSYDTSRKG